MRSQPPPSALPRIDFASILPLPKKAYRSLDDSDIPMSSLDPDTSQLLPARPRRHHVWIQGKLAEVKSVSTANLPRTNVGQHSPASSPRGMPSGSGDGSSPRHRDDGACSDAEEDPEVVFGDCKLRGYGIGGAGNIRRPTDVIYGPTRLAGSRKNVNMYTQRDLSPLPTLDKRFSIRDFLNRRADRKGKAREEQ